MSASGQSNPEIMPELNNKTLLPHLLEELRCVPRGVLGCEPGNMFYDLRCSRFSLFLHENSELILPALVRSQKDP